MQCCYWQRAVFFFFFFMNASLVQADVMVCCVLILLSWTGVGSFCNRNGRFQKYSKWKVLLCSRK